MTTQQAIRRLLRAVRTLTPAQGERSRRNARQRVRRALRHVSGAVDLEFPAPPRRVGHRISMAGKTLAQRAAILRRRGLLPILAALDALGIAAAGVRVVHGHGEHWAPGWAVRAAEPGKTSEEVAKTVRRLKRDLVARRAFMADLALRKDGAS